MAAVECPRCSKPLTFLEGEISGCENGCSLFLIKASLTGQPVVGDGEHNGHDSHAHAPATELDVREVLDMTYEFLDRFLVMQDDGLRVLSLWIFHSWAFQAAETTPYISIRSPERESGKTRVIEVCQLLVRSPEQVADASVSSLFRSIEKYRSTLLFDEVDGVFRGRDEDSKELKRLLNAGYRTGASVLRTVGDGHEPTRFSVFSPKLLAGLGGLPDTLESRCVPITMKRRLPHEQVERLRLRVVKPEAEVLAAHIEEVASGAIPKLTEAFPKLPDALGDRAADCAEPLLAIADYAAGPWPALARKALVALQGGRTIEDESIGTRLITDVKTVFAENDRVTTRDLLAGLHELEEAPWSDWFGRPLSASKLNRLLHEFDISSRTVRFGDGTAKGFTADQFADAWSRYVPSETSHRHNARQDWEGGGSNDVTPEDVLRHENGRNPAPEPGCDVVTAEEEDPALDDTNGWTPEDAEQFIQETKEMFPGSLDLGLETG